MNSKIEIAFCFDEKMMYPAYVAIASLLDFKNDEKIHYNISCICSEKYRNALSPLECSRTLSIRLFLTYLDWVFVRAM